jgi:hypothetical protein
MRGSAGNFIGKMISFANSVGDSRTFFSGTFDFPTAALLD